MRIAFVGCGYAGDLYIRDLRKYPYVEVVAVTDRDQERLAQFGNFYSVKTYPTVEALLADPSIEMIVNLTNLSSHFEVIKASLEAGKHVYTEKPMAETFSQACALVDLANAKGLYFSSAPCSVLGEAAQTVWRALNNHEIGRVLLVYAEQDDGPVHMREPHLWRSESGAAYGYRYEYEAGAAREHAGYFMAWFAAFFGPAKTVTSFSACLWPDREVVPGEPLGITTSDFSTACITFESGVVVRLTTSMVAPHNHGVQIIGEKGVLTVDECWNYCSPVYVDKYSKFRLRLNRLPILRKYPFVKNWFAARPRVYPPVKKFGLGKRYARSHQDFARGVAELARAIMERRPSRLPVDFCLHVNELVLAMQNPTDAPYQVKTTFKPIQALDDAALKEYLSLDW
jgi:predicted dehydrogenase